MRLCVNCRWFADSTEDEDIEPICQREVPLTQPDLVYGRLMRALDAECRLERSMHSVKHCGPDGQFFEARP